MLQGFNCLRIELAVTAELRFCIVLPHFNHHRQFAGMFNDLRGTGLPAILVDDGSGSESVKYLEALANDEPWLTLHCCARNRGKGAAVRTGAELAARQGYSHFIQIDADGQHDLDQLRALVDLATEHPHAIVSGVPVFDESVPKSRLYGREITNWWVKVETWSNDIRDAMCGFRVYPVEEFLALCRSVRLRPRMQFDTEILVHAHWRGQRILQLPVQVAYPRSGLSHFRLFRDNLLITAMHLRLVFGMIIRIPRLLVKGR